MEEGRGVFIVIEGSDGSGKATQLNLVKERLEAAGHEVETFDFPQYSEHSSYFVRRYLEGSYGTSDQVGPYTSSLFYALDRFEAAPRIQKALAEGKIVVSNRFTGSSMAHQGTKILNAEQRRGFFIWLDNLEFEMLRIPRPDVSFILRVPADISEQLLVQTGKKQDIHESDRVHLARAVLVFDDMAQLFPKDFQRIDCVRSGELLEIPTINTMLWEKISPLLPAPRARAKTQPLAAKSELPEVLTEIPQIEETTGTAGEADKTPVQEEIPATAPALPQTLTLDNASGLLVERVERHTRTAHVQHPDTPALYVPHNLVPNAEQAYTSKGQTLFGLYAKIVAGLTKKKLSEAHVRRVANDVLPVGASALVQIPIDDPGLDDLIANLLHSDLPELQAAGASLYAQAIKLDSERFTGVEAPAAKKAASAISSVAEEYLGQNHIGQQEPIQLVGAWPRNENDLVADMLYPHTGLPLRTIQERIANWPMSRKMDVFEAYVSEDSMRKVLEKAHYSWDLLTPYSTFRGLQRFPLEALVTQTLTPRHGYDIPKEIEDAGLADTYEKCFDLSLELYSDLQAAGHQLEAQYATLYGHNQRWTMTTNAAQLSKLTDSPTTQKLREKQAEAHPTLAEATAPLES